MKIAIGCDEAAYNLKVELIKYLDSKGIDVTDFGANAGEVVLYPDVAVAVAKSVAKGEFQRAVLVCGTGIGMAITANKVPGVRAAVCHDPFSAQRARKSNDAQIICFGERVIGVELAKNLLDIWLDSEFSGGSSTPKVDRISKYEEEFMKK
ncbi:ribose 5-phosphate isomerase B [Dysgonomonas sp. Marseille-P4677]|uniref:ribose 5-phosphate isomerase B n=1 Tax=Dysgonomonas sp. Marseille-P4677 TaxID=2364790 RepID=UPI001911F4F0|nr:ribose 5-phosphate isomerase B [Dysgonomonas sp. Marseille-P4677]MBK5721904.1 ribose 5-phosphate isomerase B [Dysgonomonas sp. Marseille-P4677]